MVDYVLQQTTWEEPDTVRKWRSSSVEENFVEVIDPKTKLPYYVCQRTRSSTWIKPLGQIRQTSKAHAKHSKHEKKEKLQEHQQDSARVVEQHSDGNEAKDASAAGYLGKLDSKTSSEKAEKKRITKERIPTSASPLQANIRKSTKSLASVVKATISAASPVSEHTEFEDATWVECFDHKRQRTYYFNAQTGKTTWTKPATTQIIKATLWQQLKAKGRALKSKAKEGRLNQDTPNSQPSDSAEETYLDLDAKEKIVVEKTKDGLWDADVKLEDYQSKEVLTEEVHVRSQASSRASSQGLVSSSSKPSLIETVSAGSSEPHLYSEENELAQDQTKDDVIESDSENMERLLGKDTSGSDFQDSKIEKNLESFSGTNGESVPGSLENTEYGRLQVTIPCSHEYTKASGLQIHSSQRNLPTNSDQPNLLTDSDLSVDNSSAVVRDDGSVCGWLHHRHHDTKRFTRVYCKLYEGQLQIMKNENETSPRDIQASFPMITAQRVEVYDDDDAPLDASDDHADGSSDNFIFMICLESSSQTWILGTNSIEDFQTWLEALQQQVRRSRVASLDTLSPGDGPVSGFGAKSSSPHDATSLLQSRRRGLSSNRLHVSVPLSPRYRSGSTAFQKPHPSSPGKDAYLRSSSEGQISDWKLEAGHEAFSSWCTVHNFSIYLDKFHEAGYDDLLLLAGLNDNDLKEMLTEHVEIPKPGHRMKVVLAVRKLRDLIGGHPH